VTAATEEEAPMLEGRAIRAVIVTALISLPLGGCGGEQALLTLAELAQYTAEFAKYRQDSFNQQSADDQAFDRSWPDGLPQMSGDRWHHTEPNRSAQGEVTTAFYKATPAEADAYGDKLADSGMEKVSESTATDEKTGWTKSDTVFRDESGRTVEIYRSGPPGATQETVSVRVTTPASKD
jgi:hypothetical protein